MLGINGAELLVLMLVALVVVGPERLPRYAEQLAGWVRTLRRMIGSAKERVAAELGEEAADVDWASLDPRRYDPRRIVRDALLEDPAPAPAVTSAGGRRYTTTAASAAAGTGATGGAGGASRAVAGAPEAAPFDDEAT
ncbi:Sec-independent protein translocase TatB [Actinotalea subterranea]|uniref:Sec-independent protein translocase TatB n=1 Tax=Actinotalea subterranea TaxID=2607497 RepID=UPI0011F0867E|nr:Sec-independent protein translocase TatB [Actinotalea subterranea]